MINLLGILAKASDARLFQMAGCFQVHIFIDPDVGMFQDQFYI